MVAVIDQPTVRQMSELPGHFPVEIPLALDVRGVTKRFGSVEAVRTVNLKAERGEFVAILGPSGCGKSTILRLIAGFEEPDAGEVFISGERVAAPGASLAPERRRTGMVFQEGVLFPHKSVADNIAFGLKRGAPKRELVDRALNLVGLRGLGQRMPYELSGGQQQRVALARALAPNPDLVLLDEPFASLDAALRARLRVDLRQILTEVGATVVLVTHDQEEALSMADRVAVMFDGKILQDAPPEELYHRPASIAIGEFVGDAQFLPGQASGRRVQCELGDLPIVGVAEGPVHVMVRPESLRLVSPSEETPAQATVVSRLFYGHDQLMRVQLDSGTLINARLGSYGGIRPGDRVHIGVRGAFLTFPSVDATPT